MATHAPTTGAPTRALFIPAPPAAITRVLASFDRDQLAGFVAVAIDLLDLAEPDSDLEPDPDAEPDGTEAGDPSWIEWQTRGRHKVDGHGVEIVARAPSGGMLHEDAEEDDPAENDDPPEDADSDRCAAGDDHMIAGPVAQRDHWNSDGWELGNEDDAERSRQPTILGYVEPANAN